MIESARSRDSLNIYEVVIQAHIFLILSVLGVAVEAKALRGVGRRQRSVAPLSSRWGQWAVAAYVAVRALTFVPTLLMDMGIFVPWQTVSMYAGQFLVAHKWLFHATTIPLTLAFGCLGWASRGDSETRGRWAARSMLAVAAWATFGIMWRMFGLPAGQEWVWLAPIGSLAGHFSGADVALGVNVALGAAMWVAVGVWLRSATIAPRSADPLDGFADQH
jgi:hypothetical protein